MREVVVNVNVRNNSVRASGILTTEAVVADLPSEDGGMPDMGGMGMVGGMPGMM